MPESSKPSTKNSPATVEWLTIRTKPCRPARVVDSNKNARPLVGALFARSSSMIVAVTERTASVALTGDDSSSLKCSSGSTASSFTSATGTVRRASPGANVNTPCTGP